MSERLAGGSAELDLSRFPVVSLAEHGILSDAHRVEVIEALDTLVQRRGRHAVVLDLTLGAPLPETQRVYVAEHVQLNHAEIAAKWAALAVVVRPPLLQGIPTAAFWLKVAPVPARAFTNVDEALAWARARATQAGTGEHAVPGAAPRGRTQGSR